MVSGSVLISNAARTLTFFASVAISASLLAGCGADRNGTASSTEGDAATRPGRDAGRHDDSRLRAALLPAQSLPGLAGQRTESDLSTAFGTLASTIAGSTTDPPGCARVVQGSNFGADPTALRGWGFQLAGPGGYVAEAVAQSSTRIDLAGAADALRNCAHATVRQNGIVASSTIQLLPDVAVAGPTMLAYEQAVGLPGQPAALRVRTVVMARDDVAVLIATAGPGLDASALAEQAWHHASDELE